MPKKTKRQKIQATHRRGHNKGKEELVLQHTKAPEAISIQVQSHAPAKKKQTPVSPIFTKAAAETTYFKKDLLKSLVITVILILIQVGIYTAQLTGTIDISTIIRN